MKFAPFIPPKRSLMGPGPSDVHPRVLAAMARPTIGHLDPKFITLMDEIRELLKLTFVTQNRLTFPISAPGSAGMEACVVNLVEPGDKVIVCENGVFGKRITENVQRSGGIAIIVDDRWGSAVTPERLDAALAEHRDAKHVAFVHGETSTGALSDASRLSAIAKSYGCLTICDAVTSLGGVPVLVDEWQLDAVYSGTQKCLSCPPGLSPVTFSERAIAHIKGRKHKVQSWFLDTTLLMAYWDGQSKRAYHHTAPINALYGLHEALIMLHEEGLEPSFARHRKNHLILKEKLDHLGIDFLVDESARLPQLNAINIPSKITNEETVRLTLLNEHNIEIGAGLGPLAGKIWRIGLMGQSSSPSHIERLIKALGPILQT